MDLEPLPNHPHCLSALSHLFIDDTTDDTSDCRNIYEVSQSKGNAGYTQLPLVTAMREVFESVVATDDCGDCCCEYERDAGW